MRTIKRDIVCALIFSRDEKLFLAWSGSGKGVYPYSWHIPGGGVEEGEDKLAAIKREVLEEIGLDISKYEITFVQDSDTDIAEKVLRDTGEHVMCEMIFNLYEIHIDDKNADEIPIALNHEFSDFKWVNLEDLGSLVLSPPNAKYFKEKGYIK